MISEKEPLINVTDDQLARRYLLGFLTEAERDAVEERLLADGGFTAVLESAERDLYDEYASGALSAQERKQFRLYMDSHPDSTRRLRFATVLSKRRQASPPMWRWMLTAAAALLFMVGGAVWFLSRDQPAMMVAVVLQPGTQRSAGDQAQTVRIPPGTAWVRIELAEGGAAKAGVVRFVDSGGEVWRGPVEAGSAKVPADRLAAGDHVLTTKAANGEELDDYVFRVDR
jgi:anti-sigma-K factor RskA